MRTSPAGSMSLHFLLLSRFCLTGVLLAQLFCLCDNDSRMKLPLLCLDGSEPIPEREEEDTDDPTEIIWVAVEPNSLARNQSRRERSHFALEVLCRHHLISLSGKRLHDAAQMFRDSAQGRRNGSCSIMRC